MFHAQNGLCAICLDVGRSEKGDAHTSGLVVDHDHETGAVRGLLCSRCNAALGLFDDNRRYLAAAGKYLAERRPRREHPPAVPGRREAKQRQRREMIERYIAERRAR